VRPRPARSAALLLPLLGLACGGGGGDAGFGYLEPREPRASCPAPALQYGGVNPAVDPGPVCLAAPRPSALPSAPPADPAEATHGWHDLGEHLVGTVVDVPVPPGTASLHLLQQLVRGGPPGQVIQLTISGGPAQVQPNVAVIGQLHDPAGRLVYDDLRIIDGADFSNDPLTAIGAGPVAGTVGYPSTSAGLREVASGGVAPSTWKVLVNDYGHECWLAAQPSPPPGLAGLSCDPASRTADAVYRLYALTTPAAGGGAAIPPRTTLDLAFHLVDAPSPVLGLTADQAASGAAVARMVESLAWHLSGAGVCLGRITFYDAPAWARERFATGTSAGDAAPCGNLPQLLATSVPGERTLELFLVPALLSSPDDVGQVLGVDGTIPGPASVNGTVASGGVVSAADLFAGSCPAPGAGAAPRPSSCGQDLVAYIAAHEAGHYLGLYHPTEAEGDLFDPLSDTPRCECTSACGFTAADCAAGLSSTRCARPSARCGGGTNLMFWQLGANSVGYLSPEQALIVRSSPLMRTL
jgi:hypothetical protein